MSPDIVPHLQITVLSGLTSFVRMQKAQASSVEVKYKGERPSYSLTPISKIKYNKAGGV